MVAVKKPTKVKKPKDIESEEDDIVEDEDLEDTEDTDDTDDEESTELEDSVVDEDDGSGGVAVEFTNLGKKFSRTFLSKAGAEQFVKTHTGNGQKAQIVKSTTLPTQGDHQSLAQSEVLRKKSKIA